MQRKWDAKDVSFDNEEQDVQRPDLDAVDDRAIRLKDALRASIQIWQHSHKFRFFHAWAAQVAGGKQEQAPSPLQQTATETERAPPKRPARKKLQQPGRTGLRNLGNTCYMSSVVQSLSAIPAFRQIFVQLPEHMLGLTPASAGSPSPTAASPPASLVRTSTVALLKDMQKGQSGRRRLSDGSENLTAREVARKKMLSWQLSDLLCVAALVRCCARCYCVTVYAELHSVPIRCMQPRAVVRENSDGYTSSLARGGLHARPAFLGV
jgi:hypothetical protein